MKNIEHNIIYTFRNCQIVHQIFPLTNACWLHILLMFLFLFLLILICHLLCWSRGFFVFFFFLMQDARSIFYNHENFPIGTKVQAVWSEDGEWYVENIEMSAFLSICVFSFSFVDYSGMKQWLRHILRMAIMFVMMDGGIKKRYYIWSHSFESLTRYSSMHPLPLSSYCILSLKILFIFLKLTLSRSH